MGQEYAKSIPHSAAPTVQIMPTNMINLKSVLAVVCAVFLVEAPVVLDAQDQRSSSVMAGGQSERSKDRPTSDMNLTTCEGPLDCCPSKSVCDDFAQGCCTLCPCFYVSVDGLIVQRVNSTDRSILVEQDINGNPIRTILSSSDLGFDASGGTRITIGKRIDDCWTLEGSYLGLFQTDATALVIEEPGTTITFPGPLGPASNVFFGPNRVHVDYSSALHSVEFNLVHCCCECDDCPKCCGQYDRRCQSYEWLVGFRYVYLPENLHIFGERGGIRVARNRQL